MKDVAVHPFYRDPKGIIAYFIRKGLKFFRSRITNRILARYKKIRIKPEVYRYNYSEAMTIDHGIPGSFHLSTALEHKDKLDKWRILFFPQLRRTKNAFETLEAFEILRKKYPMVELVIAGESRELSKVRAFVEERAIPDVVFTGRVSRAGKLHLYENCHALCHPADCKKIPDAIMEAMAFGLPVITRMVGNIKHFFMNGEHGFASTCTSPYIIAGQIEHLLLDRELWRSIALFNYDYARANIYLGADNIHHHRSANSPEQASIAKSNILNQEEAASFLN